MDEEKSYDPRYEGTAAVDRPATPVENATMELENEQGMLYELIHQLASKLTPVLKHKYKTSEIGLLTADKPSEDTTAHSPYVRQLSSCSRRTRSTREVVEHLLQNLEV